MKTNTAYVTENTVSALAVFVLCIAFVFQYPLANHPVWLTLVIALNMFAFFKLVKNGATEEFRYQWLLPLSVGTLWQISSSQPATVSYGLFITLVCAVFSLPLKHAVTSAVCMNLLLISAVIGKAATPHLMGWFVLFTVLLFLMYDYQHRDMKRSLTKYERTLKMIEETKDQVSKNLSFDEMPKLDAASQLLKSGHYESKLTELMDIIVNTIHEALNAHTCAVFRFDETEKNYKIQACKTNSNAFEINAIIDPEVQSFLAFIIKSGKKFKHGHFNKTNRRLEFYSVAERINTVLIHPITDYETEKVLGLIVVDSKTMQAFVESEERMVANFAALSARLIVAYRSYLSNDLYADYISGYYKAVKEMIQARQDFRTLLKKFIDISNMIKHSDELAIGVSTDNNSPVIQEAKGDYVEQIIGESIHDNSLVYEFLQSQQDIRALTYEDIRRTDKNLFYAGESKIGMGSMLMIRLPMQEKSTGVLFLGARSKNHYNTLDKNAFVTLATQFGVALENALYLEKNRKLANTDGLTNLYNHRCFQEYLTRLTGYAEQNDFEFSLLLLDIDHFKSFNDTYGHQAGDGVLKFLASLLKKNVGEKDIVARYGGEEFVVILTQSDLKEAKKIAEKIRKSCSRQKIRIGNDVMNLTVSIGVSGYPEHGTEPADLIALADEALYSAKNQGRNRVETATIRND